MIKSAFLLASLITIALAAGTVPAAAIDYPWCAQYGGGTNGGGRNCGFVSYAQCMNTIRGVGGFCQPNAFYVERHRTHRHTSER